VPANDVDEGEGAASTTTIWLCAPLVALRHCPTRNALRAMMHTRAISGGAAYPVAELEPATQRSETGMVSYMFWVAVAAAAEASAACGELCVASCLQCVASASVHVCRASYDTSLFYCCHCLWLVYVYMCAAITPSTRTVTLPLPVGSCIVWG